MPSVKTACPIITFKPSMTFLLIEVHSSITFGMNMHLIMACWITKNHIISIDPYAETPPLHTTCYSNTQAYCRMAEPEGGATATPDYFIHAAESIRNINIQ